MRALLRAPVRASHALALAGSPSPACSIWLPAGAPVWPKWPGDLVRLLARVAHVTRLSVTAIQSRVRSPARVRARRLFVLAGQHLGRARVDLGALVALSDSAVSYLVHGNPEAVLLLQPLAIQLATCWAEA